MRERPRLEELGLDERYALRSEIQKFYMPGEDHPTVFVGEWDPVRHGIYIHLKTGEVDTICKPEAGTFTRIAEMVNCINCIKIAREQDIHLGP